MTSAAVLGLLRALDNRGVRVWLDGGWGVDALLGEQTRDHDDLDLIVDRRHLSSVVRDLVEAGFAVERDLLPTAFALRHVDGRAVDLHPIDPSPDGGGDQDLGDGSVFHYDAPVTGSVAGRDVPCCSAAIQLVSHTGYTPGDDDRADVAALVARFGLEPPEGYR